MFNDKHQLQMSGTSMSTKAAPLTADSFMGEFERKYVYTYKDPPHFWGRFIDDMFLIYTLGMENSPNS